ncbi:isochorismate synthase [Streptomyces sp. NPDC002851]
MHPTGIKDVRAVGTESPGWLLSTPGRVLWSEGGDPLPTHPGPGQFARLPETAAHALRNLPPGTALTGVVPYEETTPAHLTLTTLRRSHAPHEAPHLLNPAPLPRFGTPRPEPTPENYLTAVARAVRELRAGVAKKVVLARTLNIPVPHGTEPTPVARTLLTTLARQDSHTHLFATTLPGLPDTPPPVLFGATPETLLIRRGDRLTLNPLAGTAPRHPDPAMDRARAATLLASRKDRTEHRFVVEALRDRLTPLCRTLSIPASPGLRRTRRLWHLSTTIRARLHHPAPNALALALLLHPTPAICGTPTTTAQALIRELEPVPRGYYTGLVGWMDQSGDGQWDIALRCAELTTTRLRLYAGAGIVTDSDPHAEFAETEFKLATMLDAIGHDFG